MQIMTGSYKDQKKYPDPPGLEKTHPGILSKLAQGASDAISRLRGSLNILRNESSASIPGDSLNSPFQSPSFDKFGTDQRSE